VVNVNDIPEAEILIHDAHAVDPAVAFALSRLSDQQTLTDTPIGVFRDVQPPSYDRLASEQNEKAVAEQTKDLRSLLRSSDTWTVN
jgi:2-oxoglutarate ferredoxin oxidoreductase subunit beta